MAGSVSVNKLGRMSSGPADLSSLMAFNLRRTESSQRELNNQCGRSAVENCFWLDQVLCRC